MIHIFEAFNKKRLKSKMILQVHDELIFDTHKDEVNEVQEIVRTYMKDAIKLKFPVVVDMNTGKNWLEAH